MVTIPLSTSLWVGGWYEPILGHIPKFDGKENSGSKGLIFVIKTPIALHFDGYQKCIFIVQINWFIKILNKK